MFKLENILTYANSNIQIIGIFIAIIGGLIVTKLLNLKVEKDTIQEKLENIKREIKFNTEKKDNKEQLIYLKNKEDYMYYIHDKILEKNFNINDYEDYDLTESQRLEIIEEIKEIMADAYSIFKDLEHNKSDVENILKNNHITENTIKYTIYEFVGYETGKSSKHSSIFGTYISDTSNLKFRPHLTSLQDNLEERDINNSINNINDLIKWKKIEKDNLENQLNAIKKNLNVKNDITLFVWITILGIIIPQIFLSIYPLFINFKWLKYIFAIYSILSFVGSMIAMLIYINNLLKSIRND